jgi:hypothetical protein
MRSSASGIARISCRATRASSSRPTSSEAIDHRDERVPGYGDGRIPDGTSQRGDGRRLVAPPGRRDGVPAQERVLRERLEDVPREVGLEPGERVQRRQPAERLVRGERRRERSDGERLGLCPRLPRRPERLGCRRPDVDVLVVERARQRPRARQVRDAAQDVHGELAAVRVEIGERPHGAGDGVPADADERLDRRVAQPDVLVVRQEPEEALDDVGPRLDRRGDRRGLLADPPVVVAERAREEGDRARTRELCYLLCPSTPRLGIELLEQGRHLAEIRCHG